MVAENKAVKAASFMILITLIGKIMGLIREQFLATSFALGTEASAFLTASVIPRIFFDAIFASAISASFIPIFNDFMEKKSKDEAFQLSNIFITIIFGLTTLLTVVCIIFAPFITNLFADGFNQETAHLSTILLRFMLPTIIFTGIAFSFVGILQSLGEFTVPAAMSIASNGVVILYFLFFNDKYGVYGLTMAFLIGWAMQAIIQIPPLSKKGYIYKPNFNFKHPGIKSIFILMLPVMVSTWIQPINLAINLKFASRIFGGDGSAVSAINYANTLYTIIVGVFVLSVANVIFPELSRHVTNNKNDQLKELVKNTMGTLMFLIIPMMLGLMTLSTSITSLIYEWGEFGNEATFITSKALFYFTLGMVGFGIQTLLSRVCYALKDGKTPLISGIASIIINIILCNLLWEKYNVSGLALASAISTTVAGFILILPTSKKLGGIYDKNTVTHIIKLTIVALFMTVIVYWLNVNIKAILLDGLLSRIIIVFVPVIIGASFYMGVTYFLGIKESKYFFSIIGKVIKKVFKK